MPRRQPPCARRSTGCSGCSRCLCAGAPTATATGPSATTQISADQAAAEMSAEGRTFEQSDALFRAIRNSAAVRHLPFRLHPSVWVPAPVATAPLGSAALGATAAALASSPALVAFHHLVVTAVGLSPPAVPIGRGGDGGDDLRRSGLDGAGDDADGRASDGDARRTGHGDQLRQRARVGGHGVGDVSRRPTPRARPVRRRANGAAGARTRWRWPRGRRRPPTWRRCRWPAGTVHGHGVGVAPSRPGRPGRLDPGVPRPGGAVSAIRDRPGWSGTAGQHLGLGRTTKTNPTEG